MNFLNILQIYILTIVILLTCIGEGFTQSSHKIWFIQSEGQGDGRSFTNPLGSTSQLETITSPGDIIMVLPSEKPLPGGLRLKEGQELIGVRTDGRMPIITNADSLRLDGVGILLGQNSCVRNIRIENTHASGILGRQVSGIRIEDVEIINANQSRSNLGIEFSLGLFPQGGIIFVHTDSAIWSSNHVANSKIINAVGPGIGSYVINGSKDLLIIQNCQVQGGSLVAPPLDCGILAIGEGKRTESILEISDSRVSGRMSRAGRNIVVLSGSESSAKARIARTYSGEVGQDGVLGAVTASPAWVRLDIENCTLEKATTNLEGTILNFPPIDSLRASETTVSILVRESIIRDATANFEIKGEIIRSGNIVMGASPLRNAPMPSGSYRLSVMDSRIENGEGYGFYVGMLSSDFKSEPDSNSTFDVLLRDNIIKNNGMAELIISAAKVNIDAKHNCWGSSEGLTNERVLLGDNSSFSQLDKSDPIQCSNEK